MHDRDREDPAVFHLVDDHVRLDVLKKLCQTEVVCRGCRKFLTAMFYLAVRLVHWFSRLMQAISAVEHSATPLTTAQCECATALLQHVRAGRSRHASRWPIELLQRKKPKLVAVALANKIARIAWKLMVSGETYRRQEGQTLAA